MRTNPEHLAQLEEWMRSYRPEELFDDGGALRPELAGLAPAGERRMGANPHANGGLLLRDLELPDFRDYAVDGQAPGTTSSEATRVLGGFLRDVIQPQRAQRATSASSARTRPPPTAWTPSSRPPTGRGRPRSSPPTTTSRPTAA